MDMMRKLKENMLASLTKHHFQFGCTKGLSINVMGGDQRILV